MTLVHHHLQVISLVRSSAWLVSRPSQHNWEVDRSCHSQTWGWKVWNIKQANKLAPTSLAILSHPSPRDNSHRSHSTVPRLWSLQRVCTFAQGSRSLFVFSLPSGFKLPFWVEPRGALVGLIRFNSPTIIPNGMGFLGENSGKPPVSYKGRLATFPTTSQQAKSTAALRRMMASLVQPFLGQLRNYHHHPYKWVMHNKTWRVLVIAQKILLIYAFLTTSQHHRMLKQSLQSWYAKLRILTGSLVGCELEDLLIKPLWGQSIFTQNQVLGGAKRDLKDEMYTEKCERNIRSVIRLNRLTYANIENQ